MLSVVLTLASLALIVVMLIDGFEAMVLPRRVTRLYRPARLFYRLTWTLWRAVARRIPPGRWQQNFLSIFGPFSLLILFSTWVLGLVTGFALLHWSLGTPMTPTGQPVDLGIYLYVSGETFFTLG